LSLYVTITRKANPLWRSGEQIALDEWRSIVADDAEFRQPTSGEIAESNGAGKLEDVVWEGHPQEPVVWFIWDRGQIDVNLPDEFTLRKMAHVATSLRANVISEQGEHFDREGVSLGLRDLPDDPAGPKPTRFWQRVKAGAVMLLVAVGACMLLVLVYVMFRVVQQTWR
jgi:hypothetical protein